MNLEGSRNGRQSGSDAEVRTVSCEDRRSWDRQNGHSRLTLSHTGEGRRRHIVYFPQPRVSTSYVLRWTRKPSVVVISKISLVKVSGRSSLLLKGTRVGEPSKCWFLLRPRTSRHILWIDWAKQELVLATMAAQDSHRIFRLRIQREVHW
jgi:hypothetical protein